MNIVTLTGLTISIGALLATAAVAFFSDRSPKSSRR